MFVLGPVLVVACAAADPAVGLYAALALGAAGTLAYAAQRVPESTCPPAERGGRSALRLRGMPALTVSLVAVGQAFGALEVVMVAFAEEAGAAGSAGLLLGLVALGSGVAGLAYGARSWRAPLARRYLLALAGLAVGVAPLLLAGGPAAMVPAALLAGVAISPTLIASFGLVQQIVPPGARTEGYSLLTSGLLLGVAAGSALGGVLTDAAGSRAGFAACVASAVLALGVAAAGRAGWPGAARSG